MSASFLLLSICDGQRTQPLKCLSVVARERRLPPRAEATARTSHAFTDSPSARAAASTGDRRLSGNRSVTRHVPPSSSDSGTAATGFGHRPRRRADGELRIAAAQSHVDRPGCQLAGDLLRRVGQRLEQREANRRIQRRGQSIRQRLRVRAARGRRDTQLVTHPVDIRLQVHDVMVTSF